MADGRQRQQRQRRQHPHGIRLAICLSQGCSVPPLPCSTPSPYAATPPSPPQLTLTRQIALLSPSMLVLFIAFLTLFWLICFRCRFFLFAALLRRPSSPFVLASISVHWWPTTPPQLVVSPFPPSTFPASSSFGDWQVSLLRAAIQRSLNELDSIRNASILRWPRKFLPFLPLTPYPLHPT